MVELVLQSVRDLTTREPRPFSGESPLPVYFEKYPVWLSAPTLWYRVWLVSWACTVLLRTALETLSWPHPLQFHDVGCKARRTWLRDGLWWDELCRVGRVLENLAVKGCHCWRSGGTVSETISRDPVGYGGVMESWISSPVVLNTGKFVYSHEDTKSHVGL